MTTTAPIDHMRAMRRDGRLVVIDGGMGSELEAQGATMDHDAWSGLVNLSDPGLVRRVHEDYVRAGADVLITNTFMSGLGPMERAGEGERFVLANRNAIAAARAATDSAGRLDLPPERFTELARGWRAAGVSMIGGCCGIGPSQIAALAGLSA